MHVVIIRSTWAVILAYAFLSAHILYMRPWNYFLHTPLLNFEYRDSVVHQRREW